MRESTIKQNSFKLLNYIRLIINAIGIIGFILTLFGIMEYYQPVFHGIVLLSLLAMNVSILKVNKDDRLLWVLTNIVSLLCIVWGVYTVIGIWNGYF